MQSRLGNWLDRLFDDDASMAIGVTMAALPACSGLCEAEERRAGAGIDEAEKECHCRSSAVEASQLLAGHDAAPPPVLTAGLSGVRP